MTKARYIAIAILHFGRSRRQACYVYIYSYNEQPANKCRQIIQLLLLNLLCCITSHLGRMLSKDATRQRVAPAGGCGIARVCAVHTVAVIIRIPARILPPAFHPKQIAAHAGITPRTMQRNCESWSFVEEYACRGTRRPRYREDVLNECRRRRLI